VNCYPFIEAEKVQQRNVKRACELLKVSRAAYYAARDGQPADRDRADTELTVLITAEHKRSKGRYGAPRIHAELRRNGHRHSRKRIARLMRQHGLRGRTPKRWKKTTIPDPAATARADAIRRDFAAGASNLNARWCGDITYIATWQGWLCLATVIDIASRRVVGFALADHLRTELVADALANAVAARDPAPGVIFHSDRGCQYTSAAFAVLAGDCQVTLSVGRKGQCWDNAVAESFFRIAEERADRCPALAQPGGGLPRDRRVHRLVQRHPAAQHPGISQPRRIRKQPPQHGQASSLTNTSALSVKAGQSHRERVFGSVTRGGVTAVP
jgi:transposase InsO family protein